MDSAEYLKVLGATSLLLGIIGIVLTFTKIKLWCRIITKLNKYPGPSFLRVLIMLTTKREGYSGIRSVIRKWFQIYGNRFGFFMGPFYPILMLSKPQDIQIILTNNSVMTKGTVLRYYKPLYGNGLTTASGKKWKMIKKISTPFFSGANLRGMHCLIHEEAERIVLQILGCCRESSLLNMKPFLSRYTHRVALALTVGATSDSLAQDFITGSKRYGVTVTSRINNPLYFFDFLWNMSSAGRNQKQAVILLVDTFKKALAASVNQTEFSDYQTYYQVLVTECRKNEITMPQEEILQNLLTIAGAASTTSGSTLGWIFFQLGTRLKDQEILQAEIDTIFSNRLDGESMFDLLLKMKMVDAFIAETMRIFPATDVVERLITEPVVLHDGEVVPPGCYVWAFIGEVGRDPSVFSQPEEFRMSRFFPAENNKRQKHSFLPFSIGPRGCVGSRIALVLIKTLLVEVLTQFTVSTSSTLQDIGERYFVGLHPRNAIPLTLTERSKRV